MSTVNPKVTAATTAAAAVTLVLYFLNEIRYVAQMDDLAKGALAVLVTALVTFLAGYNRSTTGGDHRAP